MKDEEKTKEQLLEELSALRQRVAELEASENRCQLATMLESITDAFVSLDRDWRYTYVNPQAEKFLGKPARELIGKVVWDVFPTFVGTQAYTLAHQAVAKQVTIEYEEFSSSSNRWLNVRLYPSKQGLSIYLLDITEHKGAEAALREQAQVAQNQQRWLEELLNLLPTPMLLIEPGTARITFSNKMADELAGGDLPKNKSIEEYATAYYCTDAKGEGIPTERMPAVLLARGEQLEGYEINWHTPGGIRSTVFWGATLPPLYGQPATCIGMFQDITHLKQTQRERENLLAELESKQRLLEAVLQQMPAGVIVAEASSGRFVLTNEQVQQILRNSLEKADGLEDYIPDEYQVFYPDGRLYTPEDVPLARSLLTGEVVRKEELALVWKDGIRKTMLVDSTPIRDAVGNILAAVITFYDISDRKIAEERIQLYADIVKNAQVGLVVWQLEDLDNPNSLRLLTANPAASGATGADFEALIGKTLAEIFPTLLGTQLIRDYASVVRTGQSKDLGELRYGDDKMEGIFSIKAFPLPNQCLGLAFENITQRKHVEEALEDALQELTFHVENSPLGVIEWDQDYRVSRWSPQAEAIFGWKASEVLGKQPSDWEFVHPVDRSEVQQAIGRLVKGTEKRNMVQNRNYTKDGSIIYCEWYGSALFDESGHLVSVLCLVLDITDRKRALSALREANQKTFHILESITEGFTALDDQWCYTYLNPQGERILGLKRDEVLGKNIWDLFPGAIDLKFYHEFNRAMQEKIAVYFEEYYAPLDIWLECRAYPLQDGGICIYYQDITEAKRLEEERKRMEQSLRISRERLDLIFQSSELGLWYCDLPFDKLVWNDKCKEHFGLPPEAEVTIDLFYDRIHPDDRERTRQAIANSIAGRIGYDIDYRTVAPDGQVRWIRAIGRAFYDEVGNPFRFDGITVDATERKRQEEERDRLLQREQAARAQAEAANRIKDEFLAVLSHELRTPLNPILGWSKLLRKARSTSPEGVSRKLDDKTIDRALETIERNAQLQTQLIEDLLDVSRILQGKLSLSVCPVDLSSTIEAALETVRLAAEAKSIEIQSVIHSNIGQVLGDAGRLQQVVWNLLSNAVKFTPSGGQVEIRLEFLSTQAQIQVSDTGKGINPDFLPYVFDYFRQADSTTTRTFGGLGLGLAIVRHLVELHGGTVQAESPGEGQGATFTIRLPLMVNQTKASKNNAQSDADLDLGGVLILIVDDDADSLEFHTFLLEQWGATTICAPSAKEALQALAQSKPDLLLSDIGMPEMDGYRLMRTVRGMTPEQGGQIPAIALTAYAGEIDQQQAFLSGFQMHLPKPVEPNELIQAIASLLGEPTKVRQV
jgi:PAS domain S-box-containing protein